MLTFGTLNRRKDATGDLITDIVCAKFRVIAESIIWCVCTAIFDLVTVIHGTVDSVVTGITGGRTVIHCIAELSAGTEQSVIRTIGVIWCVNTHVTCYITGVVGTANAVITDDRCSCLTRAGRSITGLRTIAE